MLRTAKSGMTLNKNTTLPQAPGTVEVKIIFQNRGQFGGQVARRRTARCVEFGKVRQNGPVLENCFAGKQQNLKIVRF